MGRIPLPLRLLAFATTVVVLLFTGLCVAKVFPKWYFKMYDKESEGRLVELRSMTDFIGVLAYTVVVTTLGEYTSQVTAGWTQVLKDPLASRQTMLGTDVQVHLCRQLIVVFKSVSNAASVAFSITNLYLLVATVTTKCAVNYFVTRHFLNLKVVGEQGASKTTFRGGLGALTLC